MRKEFTATVKREIILRSQGCCENCGLVVKKGRGQIDHTLPDALVTDKKALTAEDGKFLCIPCHVLKTGEDIKKIAKANRNFKKDNGLAKPPKQKIKSRGFNTSQKKARIKKEPLPPRQLFRSA